MKRNGIRFFLFIVLLGISNLPAATLYARSGIQAEMANYGTNCGHYKDYGWHVERVCGGKTYCEYKIDHNVIGDPVYGCAKSYFLKWRCFDKYGYVTIARDEWVKQEASGKTITLACPAGSY